MLKRSPADIAVKVPAGRLPGALKAVRRHPWHKRALNRQAAQRLRLRRKGRNPKACASVEYDAAMVDALIAWEYLSDDEARDARAIGRAIAAAISSAARLGR